MQSHDTLKPFGLRKFCTIVLFFAIGILAVNSHAAQIQGTMQKWAPLTLDFIGPQASEIDQSPNPFLDYRLSIKLTAPSGSTYNVPGFFAGDGNGNGSGNHWQARFSADEVGVWRYEASFSSGKNIAINTDLSAGDQAPIQSGTGEFQISPHDTDAPGFLKYGRLEYVGEHYLKFRDGPYWLKGGTDSPENFLGYAGFDGTVDQGGENHLHYYELHRGDARSDDPVFSNNQTGADSLGITGALNYLSDQGINSIYFLPMNLGGDGQETYPFVGGSKTAFNKTHYDISKLHQWNQVLSHAQRRGIALNIVLSETEPDNERWLDNGAMGNERKLFFRELIARFGYLLAAKWNLGEENDYAVAELRKHAAYIKELDWSQKPIAVHTQINNFRDYEKLVGDSLFTASSIQYDHPFASDFVEQWRERSANAGKPWIIDMDENTGGIKNQNASIRRKQILYDVFFSGGNIEWYFGYHPLPLGGDITASDFRQRSAVWEMTRYAREFVEQNLPFWRMEPADGLVTAESGANGGAEVFAATNEVYAVYLPNASGSPKLNLSNASGEFSLRWYNPANGKFEGGTRSVNGGTQVNIGNPPSRTNDDWVVLVQSQNATQLLQEQLQAQLAIANNTDSIAEDPVVEEVVEEVVEVVEEEVVEDNNEEESTEEVIEETVVEQVNQEPLDDEITTTTNAPAQPTANNTPEIMAVDELPEAVRGSVYRFSVTAVDSDGDSPIITAETLPLGMRFVDAVNGVATIEWSVPTDAENTVSFNIKAIDVVDSAIYVSKEFSINVVDAPPADEINNVDTPTENQESDEALADPVAPAQLDDPEPVNPLNPVNAEPAVAEPVIAVQIETENRQDLPPFILGADDATGIAGNTVRFTIAPIDPEGIVPDVRTTTLPGDAQFIDNSNGTRDFVWTPTSDDTGEHRLQFIATDAGSTPYVVQAEMKLTIVDAQEAAQTQVDAVSPQRNFRPVIIPVQDQQVKVGNSLSFRVTSIDANGIPPNLHVDFMPSGSSFEDNGDGSRTFTWQPGAENLGSLALRFIAIDHQDISVSATQNVLINITE